MPTCLVAIPAPATVFYAFRQSDSFARLIVVLLLFLSIYAWSVMLDKGLAFKRFRRADRRFAASCQRCGWLPAVALEIERHDGPLASVFKSGVLEVQRLLRAEGGDLESWCRQRRLPRALSQREIEQVRSVMDRAISEEMLVLEDRLGTLGTVVTVSPFLGLLGTVWGVMMAFTSMAQQGKPDIGAMAPGVSGALLTTVVGLVVAIPAVVGFNIMTNRVRRTTLAMENLADEVIGVVGEEIGR